MEDCSVAINSIHILMAACTVCGLSLGAILGWWVTSYSYRKRLQELNNFLQQWVTKHDDG